MGAGAPGSSSFELSGFASPLSALANGASLPASALNTPKPTRQSQMQQVQQVQPIQPIQLQRQRCSLHQMNN